MNYKLLILSILLIFQDCGKTKQIQYTRKPLPESGNIILMTDSKHPSRKSPLVFFTPEEKKIYIPNLQDLKNTDDLGKDYFSYREFLLTKKSQKALLMPEEMQKRYRGIFVPYPLPILSPDKKMYLHAKNARIGIYKIDNTLIKEINTEVYQDKPEWMDAETITYLIKYELSKSSSSVNTPLKNKHKIYKYHLKQNKSELVYNSKDLRITQYAISPDTKKMAIVEYNDKEKSTIAYSLRVIRLNTGEEVFFQKGLTYIKKILWSKDGKLVYLAKMSEDEYPPSTLYYLHENKTIEKLIDLPLRKEKPGFIFGEGYKGIDDFTFSPDGKRLAYIASEPGDCYMADEGGNIACKYSIYLYDWMTKKIEPVDKERKSSGFQRIHWYSF